MDDPGRGLPAVSGVGAAEFTAYELAHQRRVSVAVGPLFAALTLSTLALVLSPPDHAAPWAVVAAAGCLLAILGVTAALAVPLHRRLTEGFDAAAHRELLAVDLVRLVVAVLDTALATYLITR